MLHAQFFDQAQVLPEGADAGLLQPPLAPGAGLGFPQPAHLAPLGGNQAVGHRQQGALAGTAGADQGHLFARLQPQIDAIEPGLPPPRHRHPIEL